MTAPEDGAAHRSPAAPDVVVRAAASVRLFEARSDEVRQWLTDRTGAQRWQWTAHGLAIDPHMAGDLVAALRQAGFTVDTDDAARGGR